MSDGACCTCCRVRYAPEENPDGSFSERWACEDCGAAFCRQAASDYHAASVRREAREEAGIEMRALLHKRAEEFAAKAADATEADEEDRADMLTHMEEAFIVAAGIVARALREETPRPAVLHCSKCGMQHVDRGEWATRPHHTHLCENCGHEWRIEPYAFGIAPPAAAPRAEPRSPVSYSAYAVDALAAAKAAYLADADRYFAETPLPGAPARAEEPPPAAQVCVFAYHCFESNDGVTFRCASCGVACGHETIGGAGDRRRCDYCGKRFPLPKETP